MDIFTMLKYADEHGRAIRDSNETRAEADLADEFRHTASSIAATLPHPVTSYEVVAVRVDDGGIGTVQIRYAGTGPAKVIESRWEVRGERPVIFGASPVSP